MPSAPNAEASRARLDNKMFRQWNSVRARCRRDARANKQHFHASAAGWQLCMCLCAKAHKYRTNGAAWSREACRTFCSGVFLFVRAVLLLPDSLCVCVCVCLVSHRAATKTLAHFDAVDAEPHSNASNVVHVWMSLQICLSNCSAHCMCVFRVEFNCVRTQ